MDKETTKMIPGDELHLTMLMAPYSLNLVTGQDRQHLLAFGRAAFEAGKADRPGQCLHHIAEPETAASMLRQCIDKATFPTNMDKHSALQWVDQLEAEVDAERRHHGIRNSSAVRTLHALGYSWRGADAWQPPAPQAAVPLPLLVRDIARDLGITVPQACIALKPLGDYSANAAVTAEMARMLRDRFPAPAHPAEGVPEQAAPGMTAERASYFMRRFLKEEKLLGPNEQAAMHYVISLLAATQPAAQDLQLDTLKLARDRLADMLEDDDGQAWKEARKAMPIIDAALAAQDKQGGENP